MSRTFTIDELEDLDVRWDNVLKEGHGARRWSENFDVVFLADDGKHYLVTVEEGLTEYQDYCGEERYPDRDYETNTVVCPEVELYMEQVLVSKWRKVA
jgi:hypothetical protein